MRVKIKKQIILALDQALIKSGYAVFDSEKKLIAYGVITPDKGEAGVKRFCTVRNKIQALYTQYNPSVVILEPPKGGDFDESPKGKTTFSILNGTYWMNRMIAQDYGAEEIDIGASMWQNRIGAFSNKREVRKAKAKEFAMKEFGLPDNLEQDIYDACVLGWTYFYNKEFTPGTTSWTKEKRETIEERTRVSAF